MLSLYEILKASKTGIAPDMWTAIAGKNWGGADSGAEVKELTGVPPLSFTADGTPLLDYLISGNMTQSGTPTPTTPIQPSECGERTRNLFDDFDIVGQVPSVYTGNLVNSTLGGTTSFIKMGSAEIVLSNNVISNISLFLYDNDSCFIGYTQETNGKPIYSTSISGYSNAVYCRVRVDNLADFTNANLMLNSGSTSLPYEPYGYKIPISSGGNNLFDYTKTDGIIPNKFINQNGTMVNNNEYYLSYPIKVNVGETYTWRFNPNRATAHSAPTVGFYDRSDNLLSVAQHDISVTYFSFEVPTNCAYIRASVFTRSNAQKEAMLNLGATALPYEPYVQPTISNIYLGEVQTTRRIKKLVFNGSEPWVINGNIVYINNTYMMKLSPLICTHFPNVQNTGIWNGNNRIFQVDISNLGMSGRDAWIAYLQQQYAAGTPVTVWYVLATPKTAVVNEPLRKIGDYADTVSYEQAQVSIPTLHGQTVVDVDTTLKPSKMYIKYKE